MDRTPEGTKLVERLERVLDDAPKPQTEQDWVAIKALGIVLEIFRMMERDAEEATEAIQKLMGPLAEARKLQDKNPKDTHDKLGKTAYL
jgi:hypothetical protein